MSIKIIQVETDALSRYSEVPVSFQVESVFRVEINGNGLSGIGLCEEKVIRPYVKDYDALSGEGPMRWLKRFGMSNWGIFVAFKEEKHVGGAIVAPGAYVGDLDKRFAQVFNIRVHPEARRRGIGTRLILQAADWARQYGCKYLKIETQNINVPACRFYAKLGCKLGNIDVHAYASQPECEHETRLVWYLDL